MSFPGHPILDVVIVGAGPAGATAALILARAGARVRLIDRAAFPREKLCGDTVNPGTLAMLRRLGAADAIDACGLRIDGMLLTGTRGVTVRGRYPDGLHGRALTRRDLDWALLQEAIAAGAQFEASVAVRRALIEESPRRVVAGVVIAGRCDSEIGVRARVTIAADGRRSTIAFGLGLAAHPASPRRWAVGGYCEGASGLESFGEMHVRRDGYIGVAPMPGGLANVCVVRPWSPGDPALRDPGALVRGVLAGDARLADRFAAVRFIAPPVVLGPLAVDVRDASIEGLLLAGDAAGFIDPITGDGLRFAVRGGELAAAAALEALAHGWSGVHERLRDARRRAFAGKHRFNRALRLLVSSPRLVDAAALGAGVAPALLRRVIARAGDCDVAA